MGLGSSINDDDRKRQVSAAKESNEHSQSNLGLLADKRRASLVVEGLLIEKDPKILQGYANALKGLNELESQVYNLGAAILLCQDSATRKICIEAIITKPDLIKKLLPTFYVLANRSPRDEGVDDVIRRYGFESSVFYRPVSNKIHNSSELRGVMRDLEDISTGARFTPYYANFLAVAVVRSRFDETREKALLCIADVISKVDSCHSELMLSALTVRLSDIERVSDKDKRLSLKILSEVGAPAIQLVPFIIDSYSPDIVIPEIVISALGLSARLLPHACPPIIAHQLGEYLLNNSDNNMSAHWIALKAHKNLLPIVSENVCNVLVDNIGQLISREDEYPLEIRQYALSSLNRVKSSFGYVVSSLKEIILSGSYDIAIRQGACRVLGEMDFKDAESEVCELASRALLYPTEFKRIDPLLKDAAVSANNKLRVKYPEKFTTRA